MTNEMKGPGWHRMGAGGLAIAVMIALVAAGCGRHRSEMASTADTAVEPSSATVVASVETPAPGMGSGLAEAHDVAPDSLPPDVAATSSDATVVPGASLDIDARTSRDAVSVVLWDGIGDRQKLNYDSASDTWRTTYRVPLRPRGERVELSVTAKNGSGKWRRVWVFVPIQQPVASSPADSATTR